MGLLGLRIVVIREVSMFWETERLINNLGYRLLFNSTENFYYRHGHPSMPELSEEVADEIANIINKVIEVRAK